MKKLGLALMLAGGIFLLSGCGASKPQCTNIALYDYGDDGYYFKTIHWFQADYYRRSFYNFDGLAVVTKYLGQGSHHNVELCKDPAIVDGWYSVNFPSGQGSWILVGQGWGTRIAVRPNSIRSKELMQITEVLR
ncbi:MAG: hypothetical protein U1D97_12340 [Desulfuromonadales bacterium]|nr:hypothetical protein [Desulfuromonadales bacterium]